MTKRDYTSKRNIDLNVSLGDHYDKIADKIDAPKRPEKIVKPVVNTPLFDMNKEFNFLKLNKRQKSKVYYKHKMFTDGGCKPGTSESAIGIVIYGELGQVVRKHSENIGEATCNIAEYVAIYTGLMLLKEEGINEVNISSDSELVVNQINGIWKCKNENMIHLCAKVHSLLKEFSWTLTWIPRNQNRLADSLVNQAFRYKE